MQRGSTPWTSAADLGSLFRSAQESKNNENAERAAELAEIERQMEELTFGSKGAPSSAAAASTSSSSQPKYASPALAQMLGESSSSSSSGQESGSGLGSGAGKPPSQANANKKALAKFHQKYLNRIANLERTTTWEPTGNGTTYLPYMNVAFAPQNIRNYRGRVVGTQSVKQNQNKRNARTLVDLAPYMDPEYQEKYKDRIAAAKSLLGVKGRKNRKTRKARKTRKTRKNRR